MQKLSLKDLDVKGKRVLLRLDLNVPLDGEGHVADDTRIRSSLHSIRYVLEGGGMALLCSHLGRPKTRELKNDSLSEQTCWENRYDPKLSLKPIWIHLKKLLEEEKLLRKGYFIKERIDSDEAEKVIQSLEEGDVVLFENLRFYPEEDLGSHNHIPKSPVSANLLPDSKILKSTSEDRAFHQEWSQEWPAPIPWINKLVHWCDLFVNDAFGVLHRSHASVVTFPQLFSGKTAMGFLVERELENLSPLLGEIGQENRPFYLIIGGGKVSSKLGLLLSSLEKVDGVFIGGGMAFTFFRALGMEVGDSLYEPSLIGAAKECIELCARRGIPLHLPRDIVITNTLHEKHSRNEERETKTIQISLGTPLSSGIPHQSNGETGAENQIPKGYMGVDIGKATVEEWGKVLKSGKSIFWNGPMGIYEEPPFDEGTNALARLLARISGDRISGDRVSGDVVVGGGDSLAVIKRLQLEEHFKHLSTGGGATLTLLETGSLVGLRALSDT